MKILLANDDGIDAEGIKILEEHLSQIATVYVVAPDGERSTTSHTLSLGRGLSLTQRDEYKYSCSGYPADCVWIALNHIFKDITFDWIISGINRGANLAQDIYYSGTVAAAREGCFHQNRSIALSMVLDHMDDNEDIHFTSAAKAVMDIIQHAELSKVSPFEVLNINVPNSPYKGIDQIKRAKLGWRNYTKTVSIRESGKQTLYYIGGSYNSSSQNESEDTSVVANGEISLTTLRMFPDCH